MIDLARGAVDAALAAGASDAEAYATEASEREVRAHGGEVESLTAATQRGLGIRAWIGDRVGYAFGTDLGEAGIGALASRAAEAARAADGDEFAAPAAAGAEPAAPLERLVDPSIGEWSMGRLAELTLAVEKAALEADAGSPASRPRSTGIPPTASPSPPRPGSPASTRRPPPSPTRRRWPTARTAAETGLGFDLARGPAALDPAAVGREAAERATSMIGAAKPESRSCPVVLDPTVAASFVGLIGGVLGADAVQRGRSPFAERLDSEVAGPALVLHDDGLDPDGPRRPPSTARGWRGPAPR